MAYPRFVKSRQFKFITRTAGNYTLNSTTWANVVGRLSARALRRS